MLEWRIYMARCTVRANKKVLPSLLLLLIIYVIYSQRSQDENSRVDSKPQQKVDLVVVACKGKTKRILMEAATMVKSAVIFSKAKLQVHIFSDALQTDFKLEFSRWPRSIKQRFELEFYQVEYPLSPEETSELRDWWGPCASFRLFLPQVLSDVDSVIYVDTDVIFLAPIETLWDHFSRFGVEHVGGLAPRVGWNFKVPPSNPNFVAKPDGTITQINSGVFLMNLTRMRERRFSSDPQVSNARHAWNRYFLLPLYFKYKKDMFGDQNLINIIFHYNPNLLYLLPCKFNYHHKFCFDNRIERQCESAEEEGAAVIHGSANTFYNNYSPAFEAVNRAFREYVFEEDLVRHLLQPIMTNLMDTNVEDHKHCGGKSELFTRHVRWSIEHVRAPQKYHLLDFGLNTL